jgi:competence protein ComEC
MRTHLSAYEILVVSAIMQVGLALPMAYYFHRATVVGLPANAVAVPLTGVLMPAAVASVALGYVALPLAKIPAWIAMLCLHGITGSVSWLGGFRVADHRVPTPEAFVVAAGLAAVAFAMVLGRRRALPLGVAVLAGTGVWISARHRPAVVEQGKMEVTAIDVGQGDSLLIVTPGGKTLLVDAGGPTGGQETEFDYGENVVSPYLWSRGIGKLDAIALTHAHSDHMGGMHAVMNNFSPQELWVGPLPESGAVQTMLADAQHLGVRIEARHAGETFQFGGMDVRVLSPPMDWLAAAEARNDDSMVLHLQLGKTSALLEGDAEKTMEWRIAAEHPEADLLKVGHHGSLTSTTTPFLVAVHPQWAVISSGANNSYGFPRKQVLQRLEDAGVHTYRTDLQGAISFYLDGRTVSARLACPR